MAKKNNDLESLGTALLLMALFITGVFFLFKWAIGGIIAIISVIVVWAINLKNKKEKERIFKKWQDSLFGDSYIRPTKKVDIEELKEKLDLLDTTIYDDQFDSDIIERGKDYVCRRKITRAHRKGDEWTATVKGRNSCNVKAFHAELNRACGDWNCDEQQKRKGRFMRNPFKVPQNANELQQKRGAWKNIGQRAGGAAYVIVSRVYRVVKAGELRNDDQRDFD